MFSRVVDSLLVNRTRRIENKFNCIPWGFDRFESAGMYGIEKGKYFIVTGNHKSAKTQITDHLFMYNPIKWVLKNKDAGIKVKIIYFTLEMSKEQKLLQAVSNKLFTDSSFSIRKSPAELKSIPKNYILEENILNKIQENEKYFTDTFLDIVTFVDNIKNPTGILKYVKEYLLNNGTEVKKTAIIDGKETEIFDYYVPNDPEEHLIVIVDHASLISTEKDANTLKLAIELLSKYFMELRNKYKIIPVLVQQQASSQESTENMKFNKLKPTADGLAESKLTVRDCDVCFGIFTPFRHGLARYPESSDGYDITKFKDNIRFLEVIASRDGGANNITALMFDGATNYFSELPKTNELERMNRVYNFISSIRNE